MPIESNITYNRRLKEAWERRVSEVTRDNSARRADVRLIVNTGKPVIRETPE
jgi:hypothetical protein